MASLAYSHPTSDKDPAALEITSIFGPLENWRAIKATQVDPKGMFNGYPANDSVIIGYEPPQVSTAELQKKFMEAADLVAVAPSEPKHELAKRAYTYTCLSYGGTKIWVNQVYNGRNYFCTLANRRPLAPGQYYGAWLDYYQANDGTWQRYTTQAGVVKSVWYMVYLNYGFSWGVGNCLTASQAVSYYCNDGVVSQGGNIYNHPGGMNAAIVPAT